MSEEDPETHKSTIKNFMSLLQNLCKKVLQSNNKTNDMQLYSNSSKEEIMEQLLECKQMKVSEVMTPRADLIAASSEIKVTELESLFLKTGFLRILIYGKDMDDVLGFINLKDLFKEKDNFSVASNIKKATYATRATRCFALFERMKSENTDMAIILDEYGGIEGIISIEGLMEKILNNLQDDTEEFQSSPTVQQIDENTYIVDARTTISTIEEFWDNIDFLYEEEGDYETISGFVLSYLNSVPTKGEKFIHPGGVSIEIIDSTTRAIKTIKIQKI